jgi:hypothetical protein
MNAIVIEHVPVADLPPAWGAKLAKATNALPASRISAARGFSFEAFNPLVVWGTGVLGSGWKMKDLTPAPKLAQQIEVAAQLPRTKQQFVSQMIETVIAQAER